MPRGGAESNSNTMPSKYLDLAVIDEAFGDFADLYSDVLRVSVAASPDQIQMAYFDRRSELFTLLAKMDSRPQDDTTLQDRLGAERKMDSVVLAVRILGDPEQRLTYDRMRQERLLNRRRAEHGQLPGHKARVGSGLDAAMEVAEEDNYPVQSKQRRSKSAAMRSKKEQKKKKKRRDEVDEADFDAGDVAPPPHPKERAPPRYVSDGSKDTNDTEHDMTDEDESLMSSDFRSQSLETDEMRQDDGDTTIYSTVSNMEDMPKSSSYFSCISNSRVLRKISDEISGACEDTLLSVDQVFHAFTLTEKDIRAVTKRIDKAKRQLDG